MTKTYEDGYRDGLEAAAKLCDCEASDYYNAAIQYSLAAKAIRNLPVPESKQPSVEDVARAIAKASGINDWFKSAHEFENEAKAAMRACGLKVEG